MIIHIHFQVNTHPFLGFGGMGLQVQDLQFAILITVCAIVSDPPPLPRPLYMFCSYLVYTCRYSLFVRYLILIFLSRLEPLLGTTATTDIAFICCLVKTFTDAQQRGIGCLNSLLFVLVKLTIQVYCNYGLIL